MSLPLDLRGKLPPRHAPGDFATPVEANAPPGIRFTLTLPSIWAMGAITSAATALCSPHSLPQAARSAISSRNDRGGKGSGIQGARQGGAAQTGVPAGRPGAGRLADGGLVLCAQRRP